MKKIICCLFILVFAIQTALADDPCAVADTASKCCITDGVTAITANVGSRAPNTIQCQIASNQYVLGDLIAVNGCGDADYCALDSLGRPAWADCGPGCTDCCCPGKTCSADNECTGTCATCNQEWKGYLFGANVCQFDNINSRASTCSPSRSVCYYQPTGSCDYVVNGIDQYVELSGGDRRWCGGTCNTKDCDNTHLGQWYDGDNTDYNICENTLLNGGRGLGKIVPDATFCEKGNATVPKSCDTTGITPNYCCGDDADEFYICTSGKCACCNNPSDIINSNGICVSCTPLTPSDYDNPATDENGDTGLTGAFGALVLLGFCMGHNMICDESAPPHNAVWMRDVSTVEDGYYIYRGTVHDVNQAVRIATTGPMNGELLYYDYNVQSCAGPNYYYWASAFRNCDGTIKESGKIEHRICRDVWAYSNPPDPTIMDVRLISVGMDTATFEWDDEFEHYCGEIRGANGMIPSHYTADLWEYTRSDDKVQLSLEGLESGKTYTVKVAGYLGHTRDVFVGYDFMELFPSTQSCGQTCYKTIIFTTTSGCGDNPYSGGEGDTSADDCYAAVPSSHPSYWNVASGDSTSLCYLGKCCGDDSHENAWFCFAGGSGYKSPEEQNELPLMFNDVSFNCLGSDKACCEERGSCVYNGVCYPSPYTDMAQSPIINNNKAYPVGVQSDKVTFCLNQIDLGFGFWVDCDEKLYVSVGGGVSFRVPQPSTCEICGGKWTNSGEDDVGEYGVMGNLGCCGDDADEHYVCAGDGCACCKSADAIVDASGKCTYCKTEGETCGVDGECCATGNSGSAMYCGTTDFYGETLTTPVCCEIGEGYNQYTEICENTEQCYPEARGPCAYAPPLTSNAWWESLGCVEGGVQACCRFDMKYGIPNYYEYEEIVTY